MKKEKVQDKKDKQKEEKQGNKTKSKKQNSNKEIENKKIKETNTKENNKTKKGKTSKETKSDSKKKGKTNKDKKEKIKNNKVRNILIIILSIILIVCITYIAIYLYNANKNKNLYNDIQEETDETTNEITKTEEAFSDKVKELQTEYPDVKGWIRIENSNINYPLLQTSNNEYYTNHNYKKEKSSYGSIFINSNSNIKDENSNIIIYGHDMKDNQMFTDLLKYGDKNFYEEHKTIKIATEESENDYEIVAVFKSRVFYKDEKNVFRYYQQYNFKNEKIYNQYVNNCKRIQLYDTGVVPNFGEQLITLITCEYSQENGRMVVVARRTKE